MDQTMLIFEAAAHAGIVDAAMPDILARSTTYFGATELTPESVQQFLAGLRTEAPHLFAPAASHAAPRSEEIPSWLPPHELPKGLAWGEGGH